MRPSIGSTDLKTHRTLRRPYLATSGLLATASLSVLYGCSSVSIEDRTSDPVFRNASSIYTLSAQMTETDGASDVHLWAVDDTGMYPLTGPAGGGLWTGPIAVHPCAQTLRYRYQADFATTSNTRDSVVFPEVGYFEHAIIGTLPAICDGRFGRSFVVNSQEDLPDNDLSDGICQASNHLCTLRAAVMQANSSTGADLITVPSGRFSLSVGPEPLEGAVDAVGDLDITESVTIRGAGTGTIIDGNSTDRIFDIWGDRQAVQVHIDNLILTGGRSRGPGGAIRNHAALRLTQVTLSDNRCDYGTSGLGVFSDAQGGAIFNSGLLDVEQSTMHGNTPFDDGPGGAIFNHAGAEAHISQSVLSGNGGDGTRGGGAIYNQGTLSVSNSTIAANQAFAGGTAILSVGPLTLHYVTIALNRGSRGYTPVAVMQSQRPAANVTGTLFADNGPIGRTGVEGYFQSWGYNVLDETPALEAHWRGSDTDQLGVFVVLSDLRDNGRALDGGPGESILPTSYGTPQLLDVGPSSAGLSMAECPPVDQRGYPRPQGSSPTAPVRCDVGAVERRPTE